PWQRDSAVMGVEFNLQNPDAPASASHDSWLKQKKEEGWRYGPVKNAEEKTHPCYVPYEELPAEQQAKDHLFKSIVAALAPLLEGYEKPKKGILKPAPEGAQKGTSVGKEPIKEQVELADEMDDSGRYTTTPSKLHADPVESSPVNDKPITGREEKPAKAK